MRRKYQRHGFLRQAASFWLLSLLAGSGAMCLSLAGDAVDTLHRSAAAHAGTNHFLYSRWDGQQSDAAASTQLIQKVGSFSVRRPETEQFIGGWLEQSEKILINTLPQENWLESETKQALRDKLIFNQDTEYDFSEWLAARRETAIRDLTTGSADYLTDYFVGMTEAGAERLSFVRNIEWDYQTELGSRRWQTGLSALGALRETNDDAIVWQLRGYAAEESSAGANAGLIYRRAVDGMMLGANIFGDYEQYGDNDDSFLRWSFGAELRSAWLDIFANRYEAITDGEEQEDGDYLYTQSGHDIEVRVHAPQYLWVSGGLTYYQWEGEYGDDDDTGVRYNLAFDLFSDSTSGLKLEIDLDSPEDGGTDWGGRIAYRHTFGAPVSGGAVYSEATFDPRAYFFSPVRREYSQRIRESGEGSDTVLAKLGRETAFLLIPDGEQILTVELKESGGVAPVTTEYEFDAKLATEARTDGSGKVTLNRGSQWQIDMTQETTLSFLDEGAALSLHGGEITLSNNGGMDRVVLDEVTVTLLGTDLVFRYDSSGGGGNGGASIILREGEIAYVLPAGAAAPSITLRIETTSTADEAVARVVEASGDEQFIGCEAPSQRRNDGLYTTNCEGDTTIPIPTDGVTLVLEAQGEEVTLLSGGGGDPVVTVVSPDGETLAVYEGNYPFLDYDAETDEGFMLSVVTSEEEVAITIETHLGTTEILLAEEQAVGKDEDGDLDVPEGSRLTLTGEDGEMREAGGDLAFVDESLRPLMLLNIGSPLNMTVTQTVKVSGGNGDYEFRLARPHGGADILSVNRAGAEAVLQLYSQEGVTVTYHLTAESVRGDSAPAVLTIVAIASERLAYTGQREIDAYTHDLATLNLDVSGNLGVITYNFVGAGPSGLILEQYSAGSKAALLRIESTSSFTTPQIVEAEIRVDDDGGGSREAQAVTVAVTMNINDPDPLEADFYDRNGVRKAAGMIVEVDDSARGSNDYGIGRVRISGGWGRTNSYAIMAGDPHSSHFSVGANGEVELLSSAPTAVTLLSVRVVVSDPHPNVDDVLVTVQVQLSETLAFSSGVVDVVFVTEIEATIIKIAEVTGGNGLPVTYRERSGFTDNLGFNPATREITVSDQWDRAGLYTVIVLAEQAGITGGLNNGAARLATQTVIIDFKDGLEFVEPYYVEAFTYQLDEARLTVSVVGALGDVTYTAVGGTQGGVHADLIFDAPTGVLRPFSATRFQTAVTATQRIRANDDGGSSGVPQQVSRNFEIRISEPPALVLDVDAQGRAAGVVFDGTATYRVPDSVRRADDGSLQDIVLGTLAGSGGLGSGYSYSKPRGADSGNGFAVDSNNGRIVLNRNADGAQTLVTRVRLGDSYQGTADPTLDITVIIGAQIDFSVAELVMQTRVGTSAEQEVVPEGSSSAVTDSVLLDFTRGFNFTLTRVDGTADILSVNSEGATATLELTPGSAEASVAYELRVEAQGDNADLVTPGTLTVRARVFNQIIFTSASRLNTFTRETKTLTLAVGGALGNISYHIVGAFPSGVALSGAEIRVASTFTTARQIIVTVEARDDTGGAGSTVRETITIDIVAPPVLQAAVYYEADDSLAVGNTLYLSEHDGVGKAVGYVQGEGGSSADKTYTEVSDIGDNFNEARLRRIFLRSSAPTGTTTLTVAVEVDDAHTDVDPITITVIAVLGGEISFASSSQRFGVLPTDRGAVHTVAAVQGGNGQPITYHEAGGFDSRIVFDAASREVRVLSGGLGTVAVTVRAEQLAIGGAGTVTALIELEVVFVAPLAASIDNEDRFPLQFDGALATIAVTGGLPPYTYAAGWPSDIQTDYIDTRYIRLVNASAVITVADSSQLTEGINFDNTSIEITDADGRTAEVVFNAVIGNPIAIDGKTAATVDVRAGDTGDVYVIELRDGIPAVGGAVDNSWTFTTDPATHAQYLEINHQGNTRDVVTVALKSNAAALVSVKITALVVATDPQVDEKATLTLVINILAETPGLYWLSRDVRVGTKAGANRFLELSATGNAWETLTDAPNGVDRARQGPAFYYDAKIWSFGGAVSTADEVWYYDIPAAEWQTTAVSDFPGMTGAGGVVHNNSLFVMGGSGNGSGKIWASGDGGASWSDIADAPWTSRQNPALLSHGGVIWVLGGSDNSQTNNRINEIWVSEDGREWREIEHDFRGGGSSGGHAFGHDDYFNAIFFDGKFRLYGGAGTAGGAKLQFSSIDGVTWVRESRGDYSSFLRFGLVAHEGTLWIAGNDTATSSGDHNGGNESWYSTDGVNWSRGPTVTFNLAWSNLLSDESPQTGDLQLAPSLTEVGDIPAGATPAVATLLAAGGSGSDKTYSFVSGGDNFEITEVPAGAVISVTATISSAGTLTAVIRVTDTGDSTTAEATVKAGFVAVAVEAAFTYKREAAPTEARGNVMATVDGSGASTDDYTYSIVDGVAHAGQFVINSNTGALRLSGTSRETGPLTVLVRARHSSEGSSPPITLVTEIMEDPLFVADIRRNFLEIRQESDDRWKPLADRPDDLDYPAVVYHEERIWFFGGDDGGAEKNDVWYYNIGTNEWGKSTSGTKFTRRTQAVAIVHEGTIVLMGGQDASNNELNDVWTSQDGHNWTIVSSSNRFPARKQGTAVSHRGSIYLFSGDDGSGLSGAWASADGVNWTNKVTGTDYPAKFRYGAASFGNTLYLYNGQASGADYSSSGLDDIWYSTDDGANWLKSTVAANFQHPRGSGTGSFFVATEHRGSLYAVIFDSQGGWSTRAWYSTDGVNWSNERNRGALDGSSSQGQNGTPYIISPYTPPPPPPPAMFYGEAEYRVFESSAGSAAGTALLVDVTLLDTPTTAWPNSDNVVGLYSDGRCLLLGFFRGAKDEPVNIVTGTTHGTVNYCDQARDHIGSQVTFTLGTGFLNGDGSAHTLSQANADMLVP